MAEEDNGDRDLRWDALAYKNFVHTSIESIVGTPGFLEHLESVFRQCIHDREPIYLVYAIVQFCKAKYCSYELAKETAWYVYDRLPEEWRSERPPLTIYLQK